MVLDEAGGTSSRQITEGLLHNDKTYELFLRTMKSFVGELHTPRYYEENGLEMAKVDEVRLGKRFLSYSRQGPWFGQEKS